MGIVAQTTYQFKSNEKGRKYILKIRQTSLTNVVWGPCYRENQWRTICQDVTKIRGWTGWLAQQMEAFKTELEKEGNQSMTTDMYIVTVRKYTRAKKLTPRMLNVLIERIEVHHAEKRSGEHLLKLVIHYACVGSIGIPDTIKLPEPEVRLQTRKGVAVSYA